MTYFQGNALQRWRSCSFLAPEYTEHLFWKIKNCVVCLVGFFFVSHLPLSCPAPITVFNCWKWGCCGNSLNCLGLRMKVMWSAWSHRVAPDPNPQPWGIRPYGKCFCTIDFFFLNQANKTKAWYWVVCELLVCGSCLHFGGKYLRMLLNWYLKSSTWTVEVILWIAAHSGQNKNKKRKCV